MNFYQFRCIGYDNFASAYRVDRKYTEDGSNHVVAWFVIEAEAAQYAEYRNQMLEKFGTDDVRTYHHAY